MSSNDAWVNVSNACAEHATVPVMLEAYGGDVAPGDENRSAVRLSEGSDGIILYGTPEELAEFGRRLMEQYA